MPNVFAITFYYHYSQYSNENNNKNKLLLVNATAPRLLQLQLSSTFKISTKIIKYHEMQRINFSIAADHIPFHGMFKTGLLISQQNLDACLDMTRPCHRAMMKIFLLNFLARSTAISKGMR